MNRTGLKSLLIAGAFGASALGQSVDCPPTRRWIPSNCPPSQYLPGQVIVAPGQTAPPAPSQAVPVQPNTSTSTPPAAVPSTNANAPSSPSANPANPAVPNAAAAPQANSNLQDASSNSLNAAALETAAGGSVLAANMMGDRFCLPTLQPGRGLPPAVASYLRQNARYSIADYNSPLPVDRLIYDFNYFRDPFSQGGDVYRNMFGIEKTFLDGRGSVQISAPLNTYDGFGRNWATAAGVNTAPGNDGSLGSGTEFGDLRACLKFILYKGDDNGLILSTGTGAVFPTAIRPAGFPHTVYLVPFVGYRWAPVGSRFFVQGFEQVDVPTETGDQSLVQSSIQAGYWLYSDPEASGVRGIAPTVELHVYTPVGSAPTGVFTGLVYQDVANLNVGLTTIVGDRLRTAVGVGFPLTGVRNYQVEAHFHLDFLFGPKGRINRWYM